MEQRLQKLRQILKEQKLDAVLISSVPNIFYLSGYGGFSTEERDAYIFVTPMHEYLITNALYITAIREQVKHLQVIEQTRNTRLDKIVEKISNEEQIKNIGFEDENLTVSEYSELLDLPLEFRPVILDTFRTIKSEYEIACIQKACDIGDKAFTFIRTQLSDGISEKDLANELELFMKKHATDKSFRSIVAFGKNAAIPHHFSDNTVLQKNMCVLLDFGVRYNHYCSDMTRTIFYGEPTKEQKSIYATVFQAQQKAIDTLKEKLSKHAPEDIAMKEIDQVARDFIIERGYPSIPHTLGHGIGVELHEGFRLYLTAKEKFANGMVFSIEPGIYVPDNLGVRIEDLFAIKDGKLIQLTHSPREMIQI